MAVCTYCKIEVIQKGTDFVLNLDSILCPGCLTTFSICPRCTERRYAYCAAHNRQLCPNCRGGLVLHPLQICPSCTISVKSILGSIPELQSQPVPTFVTPHTDDKQAAVMPPDTRLGIVTWNVAHFGKEPVELAAAVAKVKRTQTLLQQFLAEDDGKNFDQTRLQSCYEYEIWWDRFTEHKIDMTVAGIGNWISKLDSLSDDEPWIEWEEAWAYFQLAWPGDTSTGDAEGDARGSFRLARETRTRAVIRMRAATKRISLSNSWSTLKETLKGVKDENFSHEDSTLRQHYAYSTAAYNAMVDLDRTIHKILIVESIVEMFRWNASWLDLMILQEVNSFENFNACLQAYAEMSGVSLGCDQGPAMESSSGANKQNECYPIVYRSTGPGAISVIGSGLVSTQGEVKDAVDFTGPYQWNKTVGIYRPVILYVVEKFAGHVAIGIVHTSPAVGGGEFQRWGEFAQVKEPLQKILNDLNPKIPIAVGGDYYLSYEARIVDVKLLEPQHKEALFNAWVSDRTAEQNTATSSRRSVLKRQINENRKKFLASKLSNAWFTTQLNKYRNVTHRFLKDWHVNVGGVLGFQSWTVVQALSGSNFDDEPGKNWDDGRIADFFLASAHWQSRQLGLVTPLGGLVELDTATFLNGKHWQLASDHFPIGGCLSTRPNDPWVTHAFKRSDKAEMNAQILNAEVLTKRWPPATNPELGPFNPGDFEPQASSDVLQIKV